MYTIYIYITMKCASYFITTFYKEKLQAQLKNVLKPINMKISKSKSIYLLEIYLC